jgi:hypothetical protein
VEQDLPETARSPCVQRRRLGSPRPSWAALDAARPSPFIFLRMVRRASIVEVAGMEATLADDVVIDQAIEAEATRAGGTGRCRDQEGTRS